MVRPQDQTFVAELFISRTHQPSRAAGWERMFVVDPDLQPLTAGFVQAGSHTLHVFSGQVGRDHAVPGVHEKPTPALALHFPNLPSQFSVLEQVI